MAIAVAAQNPVTTLVQRWGETVAEARHRTALLADSFRELEKLREQLDDHGMNVQVDLGPVGDSARAAWVTLQDDPDGLPAFVMPR